MSRRYYSTTAVRTTLTAAINAVETVITVGSVSGFPATRPYTLILDSDTVNEEIVTVTDGTGTTLVVTRGVDGTAGVLHSAGVAVMHGFTARDLDEPNAHIAATSAVHGVASSLVGTTDTQSLTNKTIDYDLNTILNLPETPGPTGPAGAAGAAGTNGTNGTNGADGADGLGVPAGGATGTVLTKVSAADNDTTWSAVDGLPAQATHNGEYLTTNGTVASWAVVSAGATGAGGDQVFYENDTNVTTSYTITTGKNAVTAGPVTIDSGATVTVPSGSAWVIV